MFEVKSFFKYNDRFISVDNIDELKELYGKLDNDYLEGAITMDYWSEEIIGFQEWDLIDQLWEYIVKMIYNCLTNGIAEISFPDQPIRISIRRLPKDLCLLEINNENSKKWTIPIKEFVKKCLEEYENFVYNAEHYTGLSICKDNKIVSMISKAITEI